MKTRVVTLLTLLMMVLLAPALYAGNVGGTLAPGDPINLYEGFQYPEGTYYQEVTVTPLFPFALGDIVLCEEGYTCPSFVEGSITTTDPRWSDVVRFADVPGLGYVAIFYSDPYIPNFIYGPNDINQMIADGFARPGDVMGNNSSQTLAETIPTLYDGYQFWSETPEPGTLFLLGSGVAGLAGVLRRKLMI